MGDWLHGHHTKVGIRFGSNSKQESNFNWSLSHRAAKPREGPLHCLKQRLQLDGLGQLQNMLSVARFGSAS